MNYVEGLAGGVIARAKGLSRRIAVEQDGLNVMVTMQNMSSYYEIKVQLTRSQAMELARLLAEVAEPPEELDMELDKGKMQAGRIALAMWLPAACCVCGHEFTVDSMIERDARLERWEDGHAVIRCSEGMHDSEDTQP